MRFPFACPFFNFPLSLSLPLSPYFMLTLRTSLKTTLFYISLEEYLTIVPIVSMPILPFFYFYFFVLPSASITGDRPQTFYTREDVSRPGFLAVNSRRFNKIKKISCYLQVLSGYLCGRRRIRWLGDGTQRECH